MTLNHRNTLAIWAALLVCAIAVVAFPGFALSKPVPMWAHFTAENTDLPDNAVVQLMPGSNGALWIGTGRGLARLDKDGHWQTYTRTNTNGGLPSNYIWALAVAFDGTIWIGTNGGLTHLDKGGQWRTYTKVNTKDGLPDDSVSALATDSDGSLWVGTFTGLARLDKEGGWHTYTRADLKFKGPVDSVSQLAVGPDGSLWVGTGQSGLLRLDRDHHWQTYSTPDRKSVLPEDDRVEALTISSEGAVWVGWQYSGVARLDRDGRWQKYTKTNTNGGLPSDHIRTLAVESDNSLWVGTYEGMSRLDNQGRWHTYTKANTNDGLPDDSVQALAVASDGALWIGTHGLARLEKDGYWETYTKSNTNGGLPSELVQAVASGSDGSVWAGMYRGGLARLDNQGRWHTYTKANTDDGLPDDNVQALAVNSKGVWVGTETAGLARLDQDGRWQTYTKANTNGGLPADEITQLTMGIDTLWIGTSAGLAQLDKDGRWHTYTKANTNGGLPADEITQLAMGPDNSIWVGLGRGGLARLDKSGRWQTYTRFNTNGGLPNDYITALLVGSDGALWIGTADGGLTRFGKDARWKKYDNVNTEGGLPRAYVYVMANGLDDSLWVGTNGDGLARLDKDGHWQRYTKGNTNGGLVADYVRALEPGSDGALWVATNGGIGYLKPRASASHRIVEVIGALGEITQSKETVAVAAFDNSYLNDFHYVWRITRADDLSGGRPGPEIRTTSPFYTLNFDQDGRYQLRVVAVDQYGVWSEPRDVDLMVSLPKQRPLVAVLKSTAAVLASTGVFYFALIFPLIPLYSRYSWARTATKSGLFTKFPFLHQAVLDTRWARHHLFRGMAKSAANMPAIPERQRDKSRAPETAESAGGATESYIEQSVFAAGDNPSQALFLDGGSDSLIQLFGTSRRALLIGRSGTGKTVFLRNLQRQVASHFLRGEQVPLPVYIDLRTTILSGRAMKDLVRDALRGGGIELVDGDFDFLVEKGGFLILVDSLNELPNPADASILNTFINQDANNKILIASQLDLIHRNDTPVFTLAEVTADQASKYLTDFTGKDVYPSLPLEAQTLARNPQDLALLAEIARELGTAPLPTRRAELYREILKQDGALREWVAAGDPRLVAIYALAFRMVKGHRVLQEDQLREWVADTLDDRAGVVISIVHAIQASRLFRNEVERDILGRQQPVTGFRHDLIGKFLAARHLRRSIVQGVGMTDIDYIALSGDELWLDVFYFVIDEIDSSETLARFLMEILAAGGGARVRIVAYAIRTKKPTDMGNEVPLIYAKAKLAEDLALTPAR